MEYIIIGLCLLLFVVMGLSYRMYREKSLIIEYKNHRIHSLLGTTEALHQELKTAKKREIDTLADIRKANELIKEYKRSVLRQNFDVNDIDLKKHLRFVLPNSEIAHSVHVKIVKEEDGEETLNATVRKKVGGKFTNVNVEPTLVLEEVE